VVEIGPAGGHFGDRAHEPEKKVERMERLVHHDSASLAGPGAAPGVRAVVGFVAPAQHDDLP